MKKTMLLSALLPAALLCASCTDKEDIISEDSQIPISFSLGNTLEYTTKVITQKSDILTLDSLKKNGFQAAGLVKDGTKYFNTHTLYDDTKNSFTPLIKIKSTTISNLAYWPYQQDISFMAVYPPSKELKLTNNDATVTHTVDWNSDMLAAYVPWTNKNKLGESRTVSLAFKPILTKLTTVVQLTDDAWNKNKYVIVVKYFKIITPESGTFHFAENRWERSTNMKEELILENKDVYSATALPMNGSMNGFTVIPGESRFIVDYEVWDCIKSVKLSSKTKYIDINLEQGKLYSLYFNLPFEEKGDYADFDVSVADYRYNGNDILNMQDYAPDSEN